MKTYRNRKIRFYSSLQKREELGSIAAELRRSTGSLYEEAIARLDANVLVPESYFSLNGGRWVAQNIVAVSQTAFDKVTQMSSLRQSITGCVGRKSAIMRYLADDIIARHAKGEYKPRIPKVSCIQTVVPISMHEQMQKLFPRKYNPQRDEWSGGISRHLRKVIRNLKVEDFPEERVTHLYKEFTTETGGLHPYTPKNKLALQEKGLRFYAVEIREEEHEIIDAICKGKYGTKAALCYYVYKQVYERATQCKADTQTVKREVKTDSIPHACGMVLPKDEQPKKSPEKLQKELAKDVQTLKTDLGMLKNTQKQLVWAIKRLNERVFSKRKQFWWFHVLLIWTVVTILITLGVVSLIN